MHVNPKNAERISVHRLVYDLPIGVDVDGVLDVDDHLVEWYVLGYRFDLELTPGAGTITHLAARKQRHKLQMFKRLYRILMLSVIAVAAFFVISSLSLSNRLEEGAFYPGGYGWLLTDRS